MKILINSSTLKGTGVVQVASSFINECRKIKKHEYIVFLSPNVKENINVCDFPYNFTFFEFGQKSLYSLCGRKDIIKMKEIEKNEKPDVVFSVFGPSLWKPKAPHLMGFAYPYYVYHDSPLFNILTFKEKIIAKIRQTFHMFLLKTEGKYYVCETDDVKERLCRIYGIPDENVFTAYNTASSVFFNYKLQEPRNCEQEFRFFTLCSPYKHKNMGILNEVIPLIKKKKYNKNIKFYITFSEDAYTQTFAESVRDMIVNVGPLSVAECPMHIEKCDALFLPTLLECYSASYPEAMCLEKPIITSDLPFAKTVCKNSALYFDPLDPISIVDCIDRIINDKSLYSQLQVLGRRRLVEFGTAHDRAVQYLNICKIIMQKQQ